MLVLCTGMIRSGSTWSYNVARLLLMRSAARVQGFYSETPTEVFLARGLDLDHCVIKCHDPDRAARALIKHRLCRTIYTYREPIECLASGADLGMAFDQTLKRLSASLELFAFQSEAGGVHMVWYDDITGRPRDRVRAIADYLELDASDEAVDAVTEMMSRESIRSVIRQQRKSAPQSESHGLLWDPTTLFNERHIRDNPSDPAAVVTAAQRVTIAKTLARWTDAAGRLRVEIRAPGMLGAPDLEPEPMAPAGDEPVTDAAATIVEDASMAAVAPPAPIEAVAVDAPAMEAMPAADPPPVATPVAVTPAAAIAKPPPRPVAQRPTEAAKLQPAAVAERQRLARDLLRIIDSQRTRPPLRRA